MTVDMLVPYMLTKWFQSQAVQGFIWERMRGGAGIPPPPPEIFKLGMVIIVLSQILN